MSKKMSGIIHFFVMVALYFIVSMLPPFGMVTPMGMKILGAFVAIVYGWIFMDLLFASVFGFLFLGMTGVFTPATAVSAGFSNQTVQTIIIIGAFAAGLNQLGLGELITNFMLSRKIIVGRPWLLVIAFCIMGALFGLMNKGLFGILLLYAIVESIGKKCGYENKSAAMSFMCCMILYCCIFLPAGFAPYLPTMLMFGGIYANAMQVALPWGAYFVAGLILSLVVAVIMILLAKFVFRIDVSKFSITEEQRQQYAAEKAPTVAKAAFACLVVYIALIVAPQFLGTENAIMAFINNVGLIGWTLVYMAIFVLWQGKDGKPVLNIGKMFADIPWVVVMLVAVTIPLGNAVSNADGGIMATLNVWLRPILANFGVTGIYIFVLVFLGVLTQFTHNFVAGAVFLPLFGTVGASLGADPYLLFFFMFTALNVSFATPAASMNTGFAFGSPQVNPKWAYIWGWILLIVTIIVALIGIPIWTALI